MRKNINILRFSFICFSIGCFAQNQPIYENTFITLDKNQETSKISSMNSVNEVVNSKLKLNSDYNFKDTKQNEVKDELGEVHTKLQQYYKGLKVENAIINVHSKKNQIISFNGEYSNFLSIDIVPKINESSAFSKALSFIGASKYIWQDKNESTTYLKNENEAVASIPKAELVVCRNFNDLSKIDFRLAYKFEIYAIEPLSRDLIYVDANSGEIIFKDAIIKHVGGTAQTRYSGSRTIQTTAVAGSGFQLKDYTRGNGIETYNWNKGGIDIFTITNFVDNDNNWSSAEYNNANKDNAALDSHFAVEQTYDYFLTKHNRNSYDNAGGVLKSYVHYGEDYFNAFWNGTSMYFGDGNFINNYNPLTTIDITAHELGHGICTKSANLIYSYESGALNESFSDIWGACVEYFTDSTKSTWVQGEDMTKPLRSMSNPNTFNQPDTYLGTYWYSGTGDEGGVHYNSGVQNFWFYLLSVGGSGTNDLNNIYSVSAIGIEKAAKIAYRSETVYLTPSSNYAAARSASIQAALDLFGCGSLEHISTQNAWYAVGVGASAPATNLTINLPITVIKNFYSSNTITASSKINDNLIVNFRSNQIILKPGFNVSARNALSASFRAYVDPCVARVVTSANNNNNNSSNAFEIQTIIKSSEKINPIITPNPSNGIFKISMGKLSEGSVNVSDILGRTVYSHIFKDQNEIEVDLQNQYSGIYLVTIISDNDKFVKKIIKN